VFAVLLLFSPFTVLCQSSNPTRSEIVHVCPDEGYPGITPVLFAPNLLNHPEGYHSAPVFTPDGRAAYCSPMTQNEVIHLLTWNGMSWETPVPLGFPDFRGATDPFLSPDGSRLYFLSFQPPEDDPVARERIWYADRTGDGWSNPRILDPVIARHPTHWTFSVASNRNLYFMSEYYGGQDICVARYEGTGYGQPVKLGEAVNSGGRNLCPCVSPDERYLVFARIGPETRKADLYVSFRKADGSWSTATPLPEEVNSNAHELAPTVSPDNRYLFFVSNRSGTSRIWWVNASVIETLCSQRESYK